MAQYQLPIVICVFSDGGYGVLRTIQDGVMGDRFGVDQQNPDFAKVAEGMGLTDGRVEGVEEFEEAFELAVERQGPTLLDIDLTALAPMTFPIPPHQRRA